MDLGQVALTRRVDEVAERVRSVHRQLGAVDTAGWTGLAAARFRARLGDAAQEVAGVAETCDRLSGRVTEHVRALELVAS
jgi:hypothetical protein